MDLSSFESKEKVLERLRHLLPMGVVVQLTTAVLHWRLPQPKAYWDSIVYVRDRFADGTPALVAVLRDGEDDDVGDLCTEKWHIDYPHNNGPVAAKYVRITSFTAMRLHATLRHSKLTCPGFHESWMSAMHDRLVHLHLLPMPDKSQCCFPLKRLLPHFGPILHILHLAPLDFPDGHEFTHSIVQEHERRGAKRGLRFVLLAMSFPDDQNLLRALQRYIDDVDRMPYTFEAVFKLEDSQRQLMPNTVAAATSLLTAHGFQRFSQTRVHRRVGEHIRIGSTDKPLLFK